MWAIPFISMRAPLRRSLHACLGQVHPVRGAWLAILIAALGLTKSVALADSEQLGAPAPSVAEPAPTMASAATLHDEIAAKRLALQSDFADLRRRLELASRSQTYADRDALLREVDLLRELERLYGQ